MTYDRKIQISAAGSRKSTFWPSQELYLSELYEKLKNPTRGIEKQGEYMGYKKAQQDNLKDVGGFVAGTLKGNRRKAGCIIGRDILTLDLDNIPAGGTEAVILAVEGLGCGYALYSTRKHSSAAPRLRVLLPLDTTVGAEEYEAIARKAAHLLDPEMRPFDKTTFEPTRLMYWPSVSADGDYIFRTGDKPLLSAMGMLGLYDDWQDYTQWPQVPGIKDLHARLVNKQAAPTSKHGVVGAFCRCYNVFGAMETFLPGIYVPTEQNDRYTFAGGSTTGGAVIYDQGDFLFSHHGTDPASGILCNAFDLVRIHLHGNLDDESKEGTPTNKLPSFTAMCRTAVSDDTVGALLDKERYDTAVEEFTDIAPMDDTDWMRKLTRNPNDGRYEKTIDNVLNILEHDPLLKNRISLDTFSQRGIATGPYPWDDNQQRRVWGDNDDSGLYWYLEKVYRITGQDKVLNALSLCGTRNAKDPVKAYIQALKWDGIPRLDTLLIDYLGADDNLYTRAVTRKAFCAAVARALMPGIKFDNMTILSGSQGLGKSTLLRLMGRQHFSDSLKTFEGKEACELIQGSWIIEVGELEAMARSEIGRIKQFLSQSEDIYRQPYGRRTNLYPRRCVFFGTSNNTEYLRDRTGNRRFWPVDVGVQAPLKNVFKDLKNEVDQLWAEALMRWQLGELLYLSGEAAKMALEEQEDHRETSIKEGIIKAFVDRQVPLDWNKWDAGSRRQFWTGAYMHEGKLVDRERICAAEIWVEALGGEFKQHRHSDIQEINGVLRAINGWKQPKKAMRCGIYGVQKGFEKM